MQPSASLWDERALEMPIKQLRMTGQGGSIALMPCCLHWQHQREHQSHSKASWAKAGSGGGFMGPIKGC